MNSRSGFRIISGKVLQGLAIATALLGSGCATLSENECLVADWRALGYTDGSNGATPARFDQYRRDCAEFGVVPDLDAWRAGRDEGLALFCRADRAYQLGRSGSPLPPVCPETTLAALADAWAQGQRWQAVNRVVSGLEDAIEDVERTLEAERDPGEDATREERDAARIRRRALYNELDRLEEELEAAQFELDRLDATLLPSR